MYGNYFTYNGASSQDYGLAIGGLQVDTDVPLAMAREILRGTMNRYRVIPNHMGTAYQEVLIFTISMIKDPCTYGDDYIYTEDEVDEIVTWLTAPQYPTLFHMYDEEPDIYKKYDYYGLFSDIQTMTNGEEVIGFTATFTTNSPYAWTETKTVTYSATTHDTTTFGIQVHTSEPNSPVYPIITIIPNIDADLDEGHRVPITIVNDVDGKELNLRLHKLRTIIDSQKAMVYGTNGMFTFDDIGIEDVGDIYWPKLYNGNNDISITGQADITIQFKEPRKVGAY